VRERTNGSNVRVREKRGLLRLRLRLRLRAWGPLGTAARVRRERSSLGRLSLPRPRADGNGGLNGSQRASSRLHAVR